MRGQRTRASRGCGGHAVVIGGSMAGLAAAAALARHFDQVTVIERDRLPSGPALRKGVPQGRHIHVLLTAGQRALERLFPDYRADLIAAGAVTIRLPKDILWLGSVGWNPRGPGAHQLLSCSRGLMDWTARCHLPAMGNVEFLDGAKVTDLLVDRTGSTVIGVRADIRGLGDRVVTKEVRADLIIDASGRGTRSPQWLESLGYGRPAETRIDARLGYASRCYAIPDGLTADWRGIKLQPLPPAMLRSGSLIPIEGQRWLVSLHGAGGDYPPTDEAGFREFARSLRSPVLYEAIKAAQPLSPIYGSRATVNRWWHYHAMPRWPERFVVLGDAAYAFNPIYGQGMSVAGLMGAALDDCLREWRRGEDLTGFARRFQRRVARAGADAWLVSTREDLQHSTATGVRMSAKSRAMHRYMNRVAAVATVAPQVNRAFVAVLNLQAPAASLLWPSVALRTLRAVAHPRSAPHTPREALAAPAMSGKR